MAQNIKLSGFRELDAALGELTKAAARGVLRRALIESAEPMARSARQLAPKETLDLSESISVSAKLSKRQASRHRREFRNNKAFVEVFVGPGPYPAAWNQEFGNKNHGPQAFMRPAFDAHKYSILNDLKVTISDEINKAVARARRKAAKAV